MKTLLALLLTLMPTVASAQWKVISQSKPVPLGHGAWQVNKSIGGVAEAEMNLIFFDANGCTWRVCDQPAKGNADDLASAMRKAGALAGGNGGYFTPEFAPLGLQIAQGKRVGVMQRSSLLGGVLVVRKGRPALIWRDEYKEQAGTTDLLQAGPRLVSAGKPIAGLEAVARRARTFVLTDGAGHWALGTCRSVTLRQMSDILTTAGIIAELKVDRALNMDGGRSTGLWWKDTGGAEHYEREYSVVRNFIAIVPKKS